MGKLMNGRTVSVYVSQTDHAALWVLGKGNVSAGVREALTQLSDLRQKLAGWVRAHEIRPSDLENNEEVQP